MIGRLAAGLTVAVVLTVSLVEAQAAVVVCQRKKTIRLREGSCKPTEQPVRLDGASVDPATLDQVPSAGTAGSAATAATADNATSATAADTATTAENAANASLLDGLDSTAFQGRIRWAHVASGGSSILSQSGGISLRTEPITGIVVLNFGEDLRGRGIIATVRTGLTARGCRLNRGHRAKPPPRLPPITFSCVSIPSRPRRWTRLCRHPSQFSPGKPRR